MNPRLLSVDVEYAKDKDLRKDDVQALLSWADKQPHLPKLKELQAILFLQSCYYRNEAAKTAIDTYFTVKTLCPEMFGARDPLVSPAKDTLDVSLVTPLPKQTPEGYTIFFVKLIDTALDKYIYPDQCRLFDMVSMLHLYSKGTSKGQLIVFDFKDISFGHLTKVSPFAMKKLLYYLQDAMPVRLKGLHFFNIVPFMDKVVALMRPFMKKELMDVLFLHNTVDDLTKCVPRDCLPQEYGGTADSIPVLHEKMKQDLRANASLFQWEDTQTVDESKRPGKPKNVNEVFGVEGTFKKLEID